MKAVLLAVAAIAAVAPTARAELRAPRRPIEFRLGASRAKATQQPQRAQLAAKQEAEVPQPTLSVDAVMAKVNTIYMAGLQRCYRKSLNADPTMSGKVTLVFTVDVKGNVLGDIDGVEPIFDHCLTNAIATWRFPHVSEPAEATFKLSLMLMK